jgi:OmpA-OmpF porin, OOP family
MTMTRARILAIALIGLPAAAVASDYVGTLKLPKAPVAGEVYSFSTLPAPGMAPAPAADNPFQLKLGYQYSRWLAVEGEVSDFARLPADVFSNPIASLASPFRASGYGVDTVATLPFWRFSFYGKMGAYHGDARYPFGTYSTSLLGDANGRNHLRYGLGVRYAITGSIGVRAQVEHYSPLGSPLAGENDGDLFSLGLSWRF